MKKFPFHGRSFYSLSIADLLEARNTYHVHLSHIHNVVATALGKYRFREGDLGYKEPTWLEARTQKQPKPGKKPRTLENSRVNKWSPPCVLVFVDSWIKQEDFRAHPDQVVPEYLYLEDGRVIPTCVVMVDRSLEAPPPSDHISFPTHLIGGGFATLRDVQGKTQVGSLGCLVTDGQATYALTNHHVTGEEGNEVFTSIKGKRIRIGVSAGMGISKLPFEEAYMGWQDSHASVNVDAGLIRLDDINQFTTQIYGLGELDEPINLNPETLTLGLIGAEVEAFGAASGKLKGEILGLFYRYKSMGGIDYVADFLIGPTGLDESATLPGDSGTIWCWVVRADDTDGSARSRRPSNGAGSKEGVLGPGQVDRYYPLAMQWGGHVLLGGDGKRQYHYALATSLSTVCRVLDVDLVRDWNLGHYPYWGEMGHYSIGAKACEVVDDTDLSKLMRANIDRIGFRDDRLSDPNKYKKQKSHYRFVPLADVADNVWRDTRPEDENNHFADMDQEGEGVFAGVDLLTLCEKEENIDPAVWNDFYDSLRGQGHGKLKKGALPFRVWQLYNEMLSYLGDGNVEYFVATAGVLAHYVGDACQPLHVSQFHHGYPGPNSSSVSKGVHSVYETAMLDQYSDDIVKGMNTRLKKAKPGKLFKGGKGAAMAVIELMRETVTRIPPTELIDTYNKGKSFDDRLERLWNRYKEKTMDSMLAGAVCLATIWQSAWAEGRNSKIAKQHLVAIDRETLIKIYDNNPDFAPSYPLEEMIDLLSDGRHGTLTTTGSARRRTGKNAAPAKKPNGRSKKKIKAKQKKSRR